MNSTPDTFFLFLLTTIALTRVWLFRRPMKSPTIKGFRLHHYMYGIVILVAGLIFKSLLAYSVGAGLIVDEIPLFLFPKTASWKEYESKTAFTGILLLLVVIYLFRNYLAPGFSSLI